MREPLRDVVAALTAIAPHNDFATELSSRSEALRIAVEGVGPIRFPISPKIAEKLCQVGRPAPFGRRGKTLHDKRVRDAWEIGRERIDILGSDWGRTLDRQLAIARERLGLPKGALYAVLDKLLVYGPGQFFAMHQDSERQDEMIGSLVVVLPSLRRGGDLVVQHGTDKRVFRGGMRSKTLSLLAFYALAFYADCHHEVTPVVSGYRIALTYQLVLLDDERDASARTPEVERLARAVEAHFSTPLPPRYGSAAPERPDRLIYLLDHEYTERSLGWTRLKNADRARASALQAVAERLDCEAFLVLADVHENWSCEEDDPPWRYRRGYQRCDELEESDADDYELIELNDTEIELRHWIGSDGRTARAMSDAAGSDEVCFTRASSDMDPFRSEHEGNMGNYGNTVDRWYHRAAFVMWPRERNFVLRAKSSPSWAIGELAARLNEGAAEDARRKARELLPFWRGYPRDASSASHFLQLLKVLAALDDAETALALLAPFAPDRLAARTIPAFVALVSRYGLAWSKRLFTGWESRDRFATPTWLAVLPALDKALLAVPPHGPGLAGWLLAREVDSFDRRHGGVLNTPASLRDRGAARHLADWLALIGTAVAVGDPRAHDRLMSLLTAPETAVPVATIALFLKKVLDAHPAVTVRTLRLQGLYEHALAALEKTANAAPRSADDWSIEARASCGCELCRELLSFLHDPARIQYAWPLSKERRAHVHGMIDRAALPVTHETSRRGSPYTLVLTKQRALFEREAAARAQAKALLDWLGKRRSTFRDSRSGP